MEGRRGREGRLGNESSWPDDQKKYTTSDGQNKVIHWRDSNSWEGRISENVGKTSGQGLLRERSGGDVTDQRESVSLGALCSTSLAPSSRPKETHTYTHTHATFPVSTHFLLSG